jgi:hypothetical protein
MTTDQNPFPVFDPPQLAPTCGGKFQTDTAIIWIATAFRALRWRVKIVVFA